MDPILAIRRSDLRRSWRFVWHESYVDSLRPSTSVSERMRRRHCLNVRHGVRRCSLKRGVSRFFATETANLKFRARSDEAPPRYRARACGLVSDAATQVRLAGQL
jgi:hypothetical protein